MRSSVRARVCAARLHLWKRERGSLSSASLSLVISVVRVSKMAYLCVVRILLGLFLYAPKSRKEKSGGRRLLACFVFVDSPAVVKRTACTPLAKHKQRAFFVLDANEPPEKLLLLLKSRVLPPSAPAPVWTPLNTIWLSAQGCRPRRETSSRKSSVLWKGRE